MKFFTSKPKEGWNEAHFDKQRHDAGMERAVLRIVATALGFIGLWWAVAYFVTPDKGMALIDKLMPVATLLIGYLANEAIKRRTRS